MFGERPLSRDRDWTAVRWQALRSIANKTGDVVINADRPTLDVSPVSEVPAAATRANWLATLPGQDVPLIWERF